MALVLGPMTVIAVPRDYGCPFRAIRSGLAQRALKVEAVAPAHDGRAWSRGKSVRLDVDGDHARWSPSSLHS